MDGKKIFIAVLILLVIAYIVLTVVGASRGGAQQPGGAVRLPSFRVSNQKLRALGWVPAYPRLRLDRP